MLSATSAPRTSLHSRGWWIDCSPLSALWLQPDSDLGSLSSIRRESLVVKLNCRTDGTAQKMVWESASGRGAWLWAGVGERVSAASKHACGGTESLAERRSVRERLCRVGERDSGHRTHRIVPRGVGERGHICTDGMSYMCIFRCSIRFRLSMCCDVSSPAGDWRHWDAWMTFGWVFLLAVWVDTMACDLDSYTGVTLELYFNS